MLAKARKEGVSLAGAGGVLSQITKTVLESALNAELDDYLGYEKGDPAGRGAGNHRNGRSQKTVHTDVGSVRIEVPRDRRSESEPRIVPKHARRIEGFDEFIISLYAKGLTTGEIQKHLSEIYDVEVSRELISSITDKVIDEMTEWQSPPLERGRCLPGGADRRDSRHGNPWCSMRFDHTGHHGLGPCITLDDQPCYASRTVHQSSRTVVKFPGGLQPLDLTLGIGQGSLPSDRRTGGRGHGGHASTRDVLADRASSREASVTLTPDDVHEVTFPTAPRGESGYAECEVDDFLDRVEAALRSEGTFTAKEAATTRFNRAHKRGRGYEVHAVDAFQERIVIALKQREAARHSHRQHTVQRLARQVVHHVTQRQAQQADSMTPQPQTAVVTEVPNSSALQSPLADQPAYDANQVDVFLSRVEATLRGADTLTSAEVLTTRFPPQPPGGRGYNEATVDALLVQVAAGLKLLSRRSPAQSPMWPGMSTGRQSQPPHSPHVIQTVTLTATEVRDVAFASSSSVEPGYEPHEVDDFLDRIEATLRGSDWLTPKDVREVRFTELPAGTGGYDTHEVDAFLNLVKDQLSAMNATVDTAVSPDADTWPRIPSPGSSSLLSEIRSLRARWRDGGT